MLLQHTALGRVRQRPLDTGRIHIRHHHPDHLLGGYVAMARKVTAAGGFYSFISHGLGRELGMGTGLAIALAYSVFEASLCGGFAYFAVRQTRPVRLPLHVGCTRLFMVVLISVLSYFDIHVSARILGVALVTEVLILLRIRRIGVLSSDRQRQRIGDQPVQRIQQPAGQRLWQHHGLAGAGDRRVLRVLVVGRLRDGAQLRRGVEEPQADRADGHVYLGDRPRHLLHGHVVGLDLGVRATGARRACRPDELLRLLSGPGGAFGKQFISDR